MRKEAAGVTEKLIASAKKEFLEHGFHDASLRRISSDSGVSTNSIYTRFGDKSGLFTAIVNDAADGLMKIYLDSVSKAADSHGVDKAVHEGERGTYSVLEYVYKHLDEFRLIFCHSEGTEYEGYFDELARIEEEYYLEFAKQYSDGSHKIDEFFIHVYCRNGWQYICELIEHGKSFEQACEFMENVRLFNSAGWKAVFWIM